MCGAIFLFHLVVSCIKVKMKIFHAYCLSITNIIGGDGWSVLS